jgi:choline kinase
MPNLSAPSSAVILAAGMGTRLRAVHADRPKGLVTLDGVALVPRSIKQL